jgi:predicted transcriptional regulator
MRKQHKDFIDAHNEMLKTASPIQQKQKIEHFPTNGSDLRKVRSEMVRRFVQTQMQMELQMYWDKKEWMLDSDLWAFFGASRERTAIFHLFNLDGRPHGWTVNMVSEHLNRDRSAVSRDLTECHTLGYIVRNKETGKQRYYLPTERLLNNGTWYAEYYVDLNLSMENEKDRRLFFDYRKAERLALGK